MNSNLALYSTRVWFDLLNFPADMHITNGVLENGASKPTPKATSMQHSPQICSQTTVGNYFIGILDMFGFEDAQVCEENLWDSYSTTICK